MAPHNVYPCINKVSWVAIVVADDAEWQCLCKALGYPERAMQEKFKPRSGAYNTRMSSIRRCRIGPVSTRQPKPPNACKIMG